MLILNYASKKELKASIGQRLSYQETSIFGAEYSDNSTITGSNRPSITGITTSTGRKAREFFARVEMRNGFIYKVS
tara:strand:+ start:2395 stop:2622 length:228 start_codon:yes stop_codon:yes gene_type:complete